MRGNIDITNCFSGFIAKVAVALILSVSTVDAIVVRHDKEDGLYRASAEGYPALFGIHKTQQGFNNCVGTVIRKQWAVTAAHCVQSEQFLTLVKHKGHPVDVGGHNVLIDKVILHTSDSLNTKAKDIALLRFKFPIDNITPIPLYHRSDERGKVIVLAGWGRTGTGLTGVSDWDGRFRVAENVISNTTTDLLIWHFDDPRNSSQTVLTLEGVAGPGDSGGPALVASPDGLMLIGVSSRQRTFGQIEGTYDVEEHYVRISSVVDWIEKTISQY